MCSRVGNLRLSHLDAMAIDSPNRRLGELLDGPLRQAVEQGGEMYFGIAGILGLRVP